MVLSFNLVGSIPRETDRNGEVSSGVNGNDTNLRNNPAPIIIAPIPTLTENQSMINRQMNWGYILDD
jgi:hypothetical protein